jgi:DNA-directed RNA polymerase subunit RPC12/RpoP
MIEGEDVMDAEPIEDAERDCPECSESVLKVGYMPSAMAFVTGYKCQECDWKERTEE